MLNNFLKLYKPINIVIQNSNNKAFKDKKLLIFDKELLYLKNTLLIFKIFVKATNKLQADKYPTIYYTLLLLYSIYIQLDKVINKLKVSFYFFINKTLYYFIIY